MEIEITLNEGECCANCTCTDPLKLSGDAGKEECQNLDYESFSSSLEKLQQVVSVLTGLKEFTRNLEESCHGKTRLCFPCNRMLWNLSKLLENFHSLRKTESLISQIIGAQTAVQSVGNISSNMDTAVTLTNIDFTHSTPPSIIIHSVPPTQLSTTTTHHNVIFRDDSGNNQEGLYTITPVSTEIPSSLPSSSAMENEPIIAQTTAVLEISHISKPSIENAFWFECNNQATPATTTTEVQVMPSTEIQPESLKGNEVHSQEQNSTTWEMTKNSGIAVPIGNDMLQLYKVLPVLSRKPPFTCSYCQKIKKSFNSLKNHIYNVHEAKSYRCPHDSCTKVFKKPCQVKKHSLIHQEGYLEERQKTFKNRKSNKPLLVCNFPNCGKTFKFNVSLSRHTARHLPERPFVCPVENCGKRFKVAGDLKIHEGFHSSRRSYVCEICGKSYLVLSNLKTHMNNTHSVEGRLKYNTYMRKKSQQRKRNMKNDNYHDPHKNNIESQLISPQQEEDQSMEVIEVIVEQEETSNQEKVQRDETLTITAK